MTTATQELTVPTVAARWMPEFLAAAPGPETPIDSPAFVRAAGVAARLLPPEVHDQLVGFGDDPGPAGALLLRDVPVGDVPATPARPTDEVDKDRISEFALLAVARRLGQPIGYVPEHNGSIVQNLVPTPDAIARQTSTSSGVELAFHTETAFHPHRPRYLVLLCLRGDPLAATTLCSVSSLLPQLSPRVRRTLREPRFRTRVDESFHPRSARRAGRPVPVLGGTDERPSLLFDADLMEATSPAAEDALTALRDAVSEHHGSVVLGDGDLLVVDNTRCVHGRSPFTARFDGSDRWLQRSFVVSDLAPSDAERDGRVITTRFDD